MSDTQAKERALQRAREWKAKNKERLAKYRAAYFQANKEREQETHKRWIAANPDRAAVYAERNRQNVRDWQALRKSERTGLTAMFTPSVVRQDYGECCWACGSQERVSIDHIVPLSRGGSNYAFNVRLLCAGCNRRKWTRCDHEVKDEAFKMALLLGHECMEVANV
jgi:5-methylcytosine-specific restriction endonuclease McrA